MRFKDKEVKKVYDKKHYQANIECYKKHNTQWRKDNPDYQKQWAKENPEKLLEYNRKFQKTEKGKASAQRRYVKRQTRGRKIINTLTAQEWLDILEKYNYRCAYCDVEFEVENMPAKDHIIPINKGGNNTKENIVPACKSCNSRKKDKIINIRRK